MAAVRTEIAAAATEAGLTVLTANDTGPACETPFQEALAAGYP
ncbi:hypothetical protein ACFQ7Z_02245 [Streptomyces virginiae]